MNQSGLPAFANSLDTAVLLHDPETGAVLDANAAAESLFGYSAGELQGMRVMELGAEPSPPSQDRADVPIRPASDPGEHVLEWQIERKDGDRRWVESRLKRIEIDGDPYVLSELRDITEFRTQTHRLRLLYRIIRHNLRNDMTVIIGHANELERTVEDEELGEWAARIETVAREVGEMADSVKRIEEIATSDATERSTTDVRALLEEFADEYGAEHPEATVEVTGDERVVVQGDEGIRFALENAIENAFEHHDGSAPEITLEVTADPTDGRATIRVVDDGPRIPEMEIDAIDGSGGRSELNHGTGVGLFVMKWCTESLGGTIEIGAAPDGGNVVEFTFPLSQRQTANGDGITV